jgi:hypothetical protein
MVPHSGILPYGGLSAARECLAPVPTSPISEVRIETADSLHYIRTHFIDRFSLDIYSLPYGSPQRRINNDFKNKIKNKKG